MSSGKRCPEQNCAYCVQGKAKRPARRKSRRGSRDVITEWVVDIHDTSDDTLTVEAAADRLEEKLGD